MAGLNVLLITNDSSTRCGVQLYGEIWAQTLRTLGCTVDIWDGTYPVVKAAERWIPESTAAYDIIHFNWDPQTINHYLPQHFDGFEDRLSLFLHDVPPHSTCPVQGIARWVWAFEPVAGGMVVPHGVPPTPLGMPAATMHPITIGVSGVRKDPGMDQVADLCRRRGWRLNAPAWQAGGAWLSTEDEIRRLARSTVNVCWYHTSGRGKSMAAMFCVAAGRPLVLSNSTMFSTLAPYDDADGIFHGGSIHAETLAATVHTALVHADRGRHIARRVSHDLAWTTILAPVVAAWEAR